MSRKEYFAYGSNLNFDQMAYRCPEATVVGTAKLDDYELAFRRGYLTILPKEGASVEGLIWSVTDHDESQLDCYEGYPTFYDKETMTVTDADGTPHEIMVYTMNAPYRDQLLPVSSRYNAVVMQGWDRELALAWLEKRDTENTAGHRNRIMVIREFAKYLRAVGTEAYMIPISMTSKGPRYVPHIFNEAEIKAFFHGADRFRPHGKAPARHLVIPVFYRLLYCCGLRPAEARLLKKENVDLVRGSVYVVESKGHKDRVVAVADDLLQIMRSYSTLISEIYPDSDYFFPRYDGDGPYTKRWTEEMFWRCFSMAGITAFEGPKPRVYDFRHTFATECICRWMREGRDIDFTVVSSFLNVYLVKNRSCSSNTVKSYEDALNLLFTFLEGTKDIPRQRVSWSHFTRQNIQEFVDWLEKVRNCSRQTQLQRLAAIRSFVRYGGIVDLRVIAIQADVERIRYRKPPPALVGYLTKEELSIFLAQPNCKKRTGFRNMVFLVLMYDTAARCQEMLDLRIQDLVLHRTSPCVYFTGKGNKTRVVPILPKTAEHLRSYLKKFHPAENRKRDDYVFYAYGGPQRPMSPDTVAAFVKKYGESARHVCTSIPERVHPHMLRHTRAMHLYQDGVPLAMVSEFLGHAQIETTKIYAHADTEMKRKAIQQAANKLNDTIPDVLWNTDDEEMMLKLRGKQQYK